MTSAESNGCHYAVKPQSTNQYVDTKGTDRIGDSHQQLDVEVMGLDSLNLLLAYDVATNA